MNAPGTLIHDDPEVDPIVPVGRAIKELGCILKWDGDVCTFEHPVRGPLKVEVVRGCPEISKQDALDIILDLEGPTNPESLKQVRAKEATSEVMWLERVLEDHPVFEDLPQHLKHRLLDTPATDLKPLGLNRRQRKRVQNGGAVVHLYAGPDVGFTLKRAVKEVGGDAATLLEYNTKRDSHEHDMLRQNRLFSELLRLAFDGQMDAIVGGPNCRMRSVLLYAPRVGFPGPCRSRAHPWGYPNLSLEAKKKVLNDDVLLFRMILLYVVAQMARDSQLRSAGSTTRTELGKKRQVGFLLEQPAEPEEEPACASFWRTYEWVTMKRMMKVRAITFFQGDFGGEARKPTTCGTNLVLELPDPAVHGGHARGEGRSCLPSSWRGGRRA